MAPSQTMALLAGTVRLVKTTQEDLEVLLLTSPQAQLEPERMVQMEAQVVMHPLLRLGQLGQTVLPPTQL